ncbi:MAG: sigma-70 family RNA polymerase sigma factor [Microscillaceae bacterium]|nr:sigma-70 family RNA polymerase sigma factor [Microscillaceae bacterium]
MLTRSTSNVPINEDQLVILLKSKDRKGFALLYDRYSAALYGVILKIVKFEELAEDVMQDSFVKIWKKIDTYDPQKGTLFTWVLNISRNTAIDKIRTPEYRRRITDTPLEDGLQHTGSNVQIAIDHIGINQVLESLAPEYQEVIDIIYFKGYTHQEASEHLGIPLGTIKTRVRIALRELRKLTKN